MSPLSTEVSDAALLFASSLQDPARPKHCARVLCGCLHLLDGMDRDDPYTLNEQYSIPENEDYQAIRRLYPECLDASVAFLALPRSDKNNEELDAFLRTCSCSPALDENTAELLQWLHTFEAARQFTLRDFAEALIRHLSGVLYNAVLTQTVGGTVAMGGLTKHRRKHLDSPLWPTDASRLLPRGIEGSMEGYAASFRLCRDDRLQDTLALVTKLIAICGRSLIPRLLQFHPEWPLRITDLAIRLCEERDNTLGQTIDFDVQLNWMCTLTQIVDFCLSIADPGQINPTDIALFARMTVTYEDTGEVRNCGLLFVCDIILKHLPLFREGTVLFPEAAVDQLIKNFGLFGGVFYRHKLRGDTTVYHPAILATNGKAEAVQSDPLIAAFEGFGWASMVRHCCAPECRETFATAGRAFARCSGCGILRYCSRPCLTRAWKHPTLPHKAVCTKLRVLRERTNLPRDRDLDPDRDRQAFFDACGADEGLTALAQDCGKHLLALIIARRNNSEVLIPDAFLPGADGYGKCSSY